MSENELDEAMDSQNIQFETVGGLKTRYYSGGRGEPILLLHGGHFGMNIGLDTWSLNLSNLEDMFSVYALDKMGQGYTENPEKDEDYTFDAVCNHTVEFIEAVNLENFHVVGHSRGGLLAGWLGLEHSESVKSVTIVDSNTVSPGSAKAGMEFYERIEDQLPPGEPTEETVRLEPEANSYSTEHLTEYVIGRRLEFEKLEKTREARNRMDRLDEDLFLPSVDRIRGEVHDRIREDGFEMPTLVIWGYNDPSSPIEQGRKLFDMICPKTPDAEMHVLNEAGHYSFRERPRAFERTIIAFCLN